MCVCALSLYIGLCEILSADDLYDEKLARIIYSEYNCGGFFGHFGMFI